MGFKDQLKGAVAKAQEIQGERAETRAAAAESEHYDTDVNKGSLNVGSFKRELNRRWTAGWKLAHIFEQDGNTVIVWERQ